MSDAAADLAVSVESADDPAAARNLEQRLMASGHERPEGEACPICYLYIELPMSKHSRVNVCCMKRVCNGCLLAAMRRGLLVLQDALHRRRYIPDRNGSETCRQGRR